jgi:hypothetical protein
MNVLSLSSREMVSLAFKCIHPTVSAQTMNLKNNISSTITNQFYWNIGNNTIIGHHFLIFPLLIKPKQCPAQPTGYIDYNAVYDFNPNGMIGYLTDSDDAFIAEPEYKNKEAKFFTSTSNKDPNSYYEMLSKWVNKQHYHHFKQKIFLHKGDINSKDSMVNYEMTKFNEFIQLIMDNFEKNKQFSPYFQHPFWHFRPKHISVIKKSIMIILRMPIIKKSIILILRIAIIKKLAIMVFKSPDRINRLTMRKKI